MRLLVLVASLVAMSRQAPTSSASASSAPTFDVVSVKRNNDPNIPTSIRTLPDRFTTTNAPFRLLINAAYRLAGYQYIGLPNWSERFDIAAKAPDGTPADQMPLMLQSLLADRFKMVAHRETRDAPIFALVVSRSDRRLGPKLAKSTMDCAPIRAQRQAAAGTRGPAPIRVPPLAAGERPVCGTRMIGRPGSSGGVTNVYTAGNSTMQALADFLAGYVGQQVVDRTACRASSISIWSSHRSRCCLRLVRPRLSTMRPRSSRRCRNSSVSSWSRHEARWSS